MTGLSPFAEKVHYSQFASTGLSGEPMCNVSRAGGMPVRVTLDWDKVTCRRCKQRRKRKHRCPDCRCK